jgi:putative DNA-invertase from lambdoid prophage Rac
MSRVFAYCSVSTALQTTDNQVQELMAAGFALEPRRIITETVSGSQAASERPEFCRLLDRLESGDVLVVTKLDRLGRNAMDVRTTVENLSGMGVRVHCMALGGMDLTSSAGKLQMQVLAAVAEFELDLLRERTHAGLDRARIEGKHMGRPPVLTEDQRAEVLRRLKAGENIAPLAREFDVGRATIQRLRDVLHAEATAEAT